MRIGVASMRCVRPILVMLVPLARFALEFLVHARPIAGRRSFCRPTARATCIAVGKVSLELCPMLTWSLGCRGFLLPMGLPVSLDSVIRDHLVGVHVGRGARAGLEDIHGKCSSFAVGQRSRELMMALLLTLGILSSKFACAQAAFSRPKAWTTSAGTSARSPGSSPVPVACWRRRAPARHQHLTHRVFFDPGGRFLRHHLPPWKSKGPAYAGPWWFVLNPDRPREWTDRIASTWIRVRCVRDSASDPSRPG